jgi:hypothetical protein
MVESGGNFEDYIRFLFCRLFGPGKSSVELERLGKKWSKSLIINDNQDETGLIITINLMILVPVTSNQTINLDSYPLFHVTKVEWNS